MLVHKLCYHCLSLCGIALIAVIMLKMLLLISSKMQTNEVILKPSVVSSIRVHDFAWFP